MEPTVAFVNTKPAIDVESEDLGKYLESIRKCHNIILCSSKLNKDGEEKMKPSQCKDQLIVGMHLS